RLVAVSVWETCVLRVRVEPTSLCVDVTDRIHETSSPLTTLCPEAVGGDHNVLSVARGTIRDVYGLGEHFLAPGEANGDLLGTVIAPGNEMGNALTPFDGGFTENAPFPILYALGGVGAHAAIFLDQPAAHTWA